MTKKLLTLLLATLLAFGSFAVTVAAGPPGGGIIINPDPDPGLAALFGFGVEPTAVTGLVADGTAQTLITAGSTEYGTPYYYATTENLTGEQANALFSYPSKPGSFSTALPTGTAAGTYYVWYATDGGFQYVDELPYMEINGEYVRNELTVTIASPAHTHDGKTFQPWTDSSDLPARGNYYLTTDVTRQTTKAVTGELNLCLNGHTVTYNGTGGSIYYILNGGTLNLYDEQGDHGVLTGGKNTQQGGAVCVEYTGSTFNMYGGTIRGNSTSAGSFTTPGGGVAAYNGAVFNMYGGVITDNVADYGGGVCLLDNATGNIYGGTITGNTAYFGGGVAVTWTSVLNLYGGTITGNTASQDVVPYPEINQGLVPVGDDVFGDVDTVSNLYGTTIGRFASANPIEIKDDLGGKTYEVSLVDSNDKYNPKAGAITSGLDGYGTLDNFANGSGTGFALVSNAFGEAEFTVAYTVTWNNWDGTALKTEDVAADTVPVYDGATPTKAADDDYVYTFSGWTDGENNYGLTDTLPAAASDVTYTATFTQTKKTPNDKMSVSINDQIALNLLLDLGTRGMETSAVSITLNGQRYTVEGTAYPEGGEGIYNFSVVMAPAQIADPIVVTITGDAQPLTTSVKDYCTTLSTDPAYASYVKERALAEAILAYGQAANNVFSTLGMVPKAEIANISDLSTTAVLNADIAAPESTIALNGASFMALTKPEFRFYTKNVTEEQAIAYNKAGVSATMAGAKPDTLTARFVKKSDNSILIEVTGVSAENMDKTITVTVTGLGTITFTGNAFAKAMASPNNNASQQNLGAALYNYGAAAKTCFGA